MDVFSLAAKLTLDSSKFISGLYNAESSSKKTAQQMRKDVAQIAATYKKGGMNASDAMKKAWLEIDRSQYESKDVAKKTSKSILEGLGKEKDAFDENTKSIKKRESVFKAFGNKVKNFVGGVTKAATLLTSAASASIVPFVKKATSAYATFEQLEGGIQTLFKNAWVFVKQDADKAFETAGMSANKYMETATSFAASLIQGLSGDTLAAAEYANRAIIDMSDNANKMGTDMESIQNAYRGFSKQNFTMLDNLKLGYGGTKTEMERLLKDAEKLTGKKYDVSNFADIVDAIHAIQVEMGVTGTTAKEASTTITGSWNATKAAWENLLVAVADPKGNVKKATANLVSSAKTTASNVLPTIKRAVSGLGDFAAEIAPMIGEYIPELISDFLPEFFNAGKNLAVGLGKGIMNGIKKLKWPTWGDVRSFASNAWKNIQGGIDTLGGLIFGRNDKGEVKWPTWKDVGTKITNAWNEIKRNVANLAKLSFGENFEFPDIIGSISAWWEETKKNAGDLFAQIFRFPSWDEIKLQFTGSINSVIDGINRTFGTNLKHIGDEVAADTMIENIEETAGTAEVLVDYMDQLIQKYGENVVNQTQWYETIGQLRSLIPGLDTVLENHNGKITNITKSLREQIKAWKDVTIEESLAAALQEKRTDVANAQTRLTKAELDREVKRAALERESQKILAEMAETANALKDVLGSNEKFQAFQESISTGDVLTALENLSTLENAVQSIYGYDSPITQMLHKLSPDESGYNTAIQQLKAAENEITNANAALESATLQFASYEEAVRNRLNNLEGSATSAAAQVQSVTDALNIMPAKKSVNIYVNTHNITTGREDVPKAIGAWDIPFDNYRAILHRNEMVLNATQARQYREGNAGGGSAAVIDAVNSLKATLANLSIQVAGREFGRATVRYGGGMINGYLGASNKQQMIGYGTR